MKNDFIILLAWPDTLCKQAGAWYDNISNLLGFSKNNYYKVGHAAIVLVNNDTKKCHYFDFGRYHAPFGHGRVRDEETDHDLVIKTKATIHSNQIINLNEILNELKNNESCHGDGDLHASIIKGNFNQAFKKAKSMQTNSPWKYGPFIWKGTNCSRFVRTIALSSSPKKQTKLKLFLPLTISPTPIGNVKINKERYTVKDTPDTCLKEENIPIQVM